MTSTKLDNRLVIFDIKDLPESLRHIMMLIISNFVKNQVMAMLEKAFVFFEFLAPQFTKKFELGWG